MEVLKINGKDREFVKGKLPDSVSELLDVLGVDQATVVAEVDGEIIERNDFSKTALSAGQKIELIRFVGGG